MARWLQIESLRVRPLALILLAALVSGCFYVDDINERPSLRIDNSGVPLARGDSTSFTATVIDTEADVVELSWAAYACGAAVAEDPFANCDVAPFTTGESRGFDVTIPLVREDTGEPVEGIRITLDGRDARGAGAKPADIVALPVGNASPTLLVVHESAYARQRNAPIEVYAEYGDVDDGADAVTVTFEVFSPREVPFDPPVAIAAPPLPVNPRNRQAGIEFVPTVEGAWEVRVTVVDALGAATTLVEPIAVTPDLPPCIETSAPGATVPVFDPTVYAVTVDDALDPSPLPVTTPDDPRRAATFQWSLKIGAAPRALVAGATASAFGFDPAAYPAGTLVELRVEAADRVPRTLACDDASPTCSFDGNPSCTQRQTWRLEAR